MLWKWQTTDADLFYRLRKIYFGGLYMAPPRPMGTSRAGDVRLKLDTLVIEEH